MLAALLGIGLLAALVIAGCAFAAVGVVLRREGDLIVKVTRLEKENKALQDQANDLRRRLSRRRNPIVPAPRKAS